MIHVVLFQPEIPPNTGNIIRTCMASNSKLHLIKPLGFRIDDASFKRAGLDYLRSFEFEVHENFQDFLDMLNQQAYILKKGKNMYQVQLSYYSQIR